LLDVSTKAALSVGYFPPLPTVMAPDGGVLSAVAKDEARKTVIQLHRWETIMDGNACGTLNDGSRIYSRFWGAS
jgi:hypothetical protein